MNTLKSPKTYLLGVLALLLLSAQLTFAQTIKQLKTDVSVIGQYDDNIFLQEDRERNNAEKQSDYLIKVRPGFDFRLLSEHTELGLRYTPTFVRYVQSNESSIRHRGNLSF
ncbi:MAG: hypothetical protein JRF34_09365, partial [Deltaproteobacteria bacterium]|nr:hypothetical protein [Deltaproteobacteria bacterium]